MTTFRCTAKTLKRFRLTPEDNPAEPSGVLGDWYVNLLNVGPQRLVLCVSEKSLLPVILPARKAEFPGNFPSYLHAILCATNVPAALAAIETEVTKEYAVARTQNRRVLGVMNDFANMAQYFLEHDSPFEASLRLSESPCKPIDYDSPAMRTRELFSTRLFRPGSAASDNGPDNGIQKRRKTFDIDAMVVALAGDPDVRAKLSADYSLPRPPRPMTSSGISSRRSIKSLSIIRSKSVDTRANSFWPPYGRWAVTAEAGPVLSAGNRS